MQTNAADVLEWGRFIGLATLEARSLPAQVLLRRLEDSSYWAPDCQTAQRLQNETLEVTQLLSKDSLWSGLSELADPQHILENLSKGAVVAATDLALIRRWLSVVDDWRQVPQESLPGELFSKAVGLLFDPRLILKTLNRLLTPEGELSETASPRLASLHSELRSLKRDLLSRMDRLVKALYEKGALQDEFSDFRDGRYVLPVRASAQSEVTGTIQDSSASGQTVFIEPAEITALNNRLKQRENDLLQEIHAILTAASNELRPSSNEIETAVSILSHWDHVQAKARMAQRYSGHPIHITEERTFVLPSTAHPLLWYSLKPEQIIRNSLQLAMPAQTFLITGPNTGGKTVLLKTLGLAAICARTGFPFPGSSSPTIPFFSNVFADLGDPQSLEHNISSFSGHVLQFKTILEEISPNSLVLLDELNTATDPDEGAALGRAFLEKVMESGAITVTTTHDPYLKGLAIKDPRILNASMAFNEGTRMPTFQLLIGVPGRSRALETAARLGIPETVLSLARSYLSDEHLSFEALLNKFEADSAAAAKAREEANELRREAQRLKDEWTEKTTRTMGELIERTKGKLRQILEQTQTDFRSKIVKLSGQKTEREINMIRSELNSLFAKAGQNIEATLKDEAPEIAGSLVKPEAKTREVSPLTVGAHVRVAKWKSNGIILAIDGDKIQIAMGNLKMSLTPDQVELLEKQPDLNRRKARIGGIDGTATPESRLDLRGMRLEEGMSTLEAYLDLAFRSGNYREVTIVHGLGTGALREGSIALFRKLPYVKSFRDGGQGGGGAGATIVEFDT